MMSPMNDDHRVLAPVRTALHPNAAPKQLRTCVCAARTRNAGLDPLELEVTSSVAYVSIDQITVTRHVGA